MSERVECEKCRKPMSQSAARCPHCSALQARAPLDPARAKRAARAEAEGDRPVLRDVSPEEARALLAVAAARELDDDEPIGRAFDILGWMYLPHERSHGGGRGAEILLTIVALPILLASSLSALMAMRRVRRTRTLGARRVWAGGIVTSGALLLLTILHYTADSLAFAAVATVGQLLVLGTRELIRARTGRRGIPELE